MVTQAQAQELMTQIQAKGYMECSALTQEGLKAVFDEAIRAALSKPAEKKKVKCTIL
jgi:cell division control protein 42